MKSLIEAARIPGASAAAHVAYDSINDLPVALRRSMVRLHREGMRAGRIATRLSLPEQWVQLFVETPPGASQH
jgi:site-specific recombinase XerC